PLDRPRDRTAVRQRSRARHGRRRHGVGRRSAGQGRAPARFGPSVRHPRRHRCRSAGRDRPRPHPGLAGTRRLHRREIPVSSHLIWYTARASGIVAWALLSASVLWGLALSTRALGKRPRPNWILDLHRFVGGAAVAFGGSALVAVLTAARIGEDAKKVGGTAKDVPSVV